MPSWDLGGSPQEAGSTLVHHSANHHEVVCHRLRSDLPHAALEAYASAVVIESNRGLEIRLD